MPFLQVFFAIWWAWMNFTWFASSFDTDDVPYRLLTLVQMAGVLVLAAGVPAASTDDDFAPSRSATRSCGSVSSPSGFGRAARSLRSRATARRYVLGITLAEVAWVLRWRSTRPACCPAWSGPGLLRARRLRAGVPLWAERARPTNWHPHHIAERYGLFAIILLGEGVLAASMGFDEALAEAGGVASLVTIAAPDSRWCSRSGGCTPSSRAARGWRNRDRSYRWGYGHYGSLRRACRARRRPRARGRSTWRTGRRPRPSLSATRSPYLSDHVPRSRWAVDHGDPAAPRRQVRRERGRRSGDHAAAGGRAGRWTRRGHRRHRRGLRRARRGDAVASRVTSAVHGSGAGRRPSSAAASSARTIRACSSVSYSAMITSPSTAMNRGSPTCGRRSR